MTRFPCLLLAGQRGEPVSVKSGWPVNCFAGRRCAACGEFSFDRNAQRNLAVVNGMFANAGQAALAGPRSAKSCTAHPVSRSQGQQRQKCLLFGQAVRNKIMPTKRMSSSLLAVFGGLGLSLGGCMAVPLAQMAISQSASIDRTCSGCATNIPGGPMGEIGKGVSDSLRKWTGSTPIEVTGK